MLPDYAANAKILDEYGFGHAVKEEHLPRFVVTSKSRTLAVMVLADGYHPPLMVRSATRNGLCVWLIARPD